MPDVGAVEGSEVAAEGEPSVLTGCVAVGVFAVEDAGPVGRGHEVLAGVAVPADGVIAGLVAELDDLCQLLRAAS